jgi:hypothetical protein
MQESYLRRIAVTGLVAIATVVASWSAVSAASASTTASTPTSATSAGAFAANRGLQGAAPNGLPGSLPAAHSVTYPGGVRPATTSPFQVIQEVSCFHAGDCIAVGDNATSNGVNDTTLAYLWNGKAWKQLSVPMPPGTKYGYLDSVSCTAPGGCVAVGSYQRGSTFYPLEDEWTGAKWIQHLPSVPSGSVATYPAIVSCHVASFCVATGGYVPSSHTNELKSYAWVWNGNSWRGSAPSAPSSPYVYNELDTVSCPASNYCMLAGIYATSDNGYFHTLLENFDGAHWKITTDAAPTPEQGSVDYINSVSCTSSTACAAVGDVATVAATTTYHGFAEVLTGSSWQVTNTGILATGAASGLNGVSCTSSTFCAAIGGDGPYNYDTTGKGVYALWNGSTWSVHVLYPVSGDGSLFLGVQCLATNYCLAGGTEGPYAKASAHGDVAFYTGNPTWTQTTP